MRLACQAVFKDRPGKALRVHECLFTEQLLLAVTEIVDDEVKFLETITKRLKLKFFEITSATNGVDAIEAAHDGPEGVAGVGVITLPGQRFTSGHAAQYQNSGLLPADRREPVDFRHGPTEASFQG